MDALPSEIVHEIAYGARVLGPRDVVALARVSKRTHGVLLGSDYARAAAHATAGLTFCAARDLFRAALRALESDHALPPTCLAALIDTLAANKMTAARSSFFPLLVRKLLAVPAVLAPHSRGVEPCPLVVAAEAGHASIVPDLLAHEDVDPAHGCYFAFRQAAALGHAGVVAVLLADKRVDPEACDGEPLAAAIRYGHAHIVELLLSDERVDPARNNNAAICTAAELGRALIVDTLLAHPAVDPGALRL
ncbi:uncharacterized protein AMSG_10248 [Thecamonas trahens ATCC 50062]|uniref:Uncharacterized protein n=1 Tax=Thecamonas trahens ATCC 50062 TaxID=461836 RepID=A0A0L0DRS9_THETB|nr:hypothetical protein AMSG_10248 [Thecamonas trahens ATCC 50062]KNC55000.1 hypothetical protein AMSG_10248 [Thecamonas trahens ATCC 50062]|eukprot:XP_013753444.1 hypothetical protein AMSG_10248 [Thecamonas trahens ATCC 50062]